MYIKQIFSAALFIGLALVNSSCQQEPSSTATKQKTDTTSLPIGNKDVMNVATPDSTYLLGVWYDEEIKTPDGAKIAYQVITDKKRVVIQPVAFKGEKLQVSDQPVIQPTATELVKHGDRYISADSPEDSYVVDKAGNLLIYHHDKLLVTCKKIL
ncbi:hypothetical protein GCM10023231_24210 [Olivibacter ginsenosidimutans]|uniref:Lipoprotein n=1 Tax=Olivibacter ginsenosidimutans TaxID=1176537 RepID=A0ABP9BG32_9SPHI